MEAVVLHGDINLCEELIVTASFVNVLNLGERVMHSLDCLVAHYWFRRNHFFAVIKTEFVITPESHPNSGNDPVYLSK
jgi:hypothetical protein